MRADSEIKRDVEEELRWDRAINATDHRGPVKSGAVTPAGFVRRYSDKFEAETMQNVTKARHKVMADPVTHQMPTSAFMTR